MTAYYNEIDPFAAQWLRELIDAGLIAPGVVDERSIEDVRPTDLDGYSQCHFFAGIGVWSYALRLAGWPDNKPIWTASCPCQPFSASGKRAGFDDDRHLWPSLAWLVEQFRPATIIGEQVAGKSAEPWIDLVQTDLEAMDYAFGCVPFPSAGVGAPHLRDRAYWVANASGPGLAQRVSDGRIQREAMGAQPGEAVVGSGDFGGLADAEHTVPSRGESQQFDKTDGAGKTVRPDTSNKVTPGSSEPGPTNGRWANVDWLHCRDGKWRPVEPGTFPLAHGAPARVGRLRGYGNAINAEAASEFIKAVIDYA